MAGCKSCAHYVMCEKATDTGSCNKFLDSRKVELSAHKSPVKASEDTRKYYCISCHSVSVGPHCECGHLCHNLLSETKVVETVISVKCKVTFRKGSLKALKSKIVPVPMCTFNGWDKDLGDWEIERMGVADGENS